MTKTDVLWRVVEAYGILISLGVGLIIVVAVVAMVLWNHEAKWKDVILGLGGMMLIGCSLWMTNDLAMADRNTIRPNVSDWLTRLTYQSNRLHRKLGESTCQLKAGDKTPDKYEQALLKDSYDVAVLAGAVKEAVGPFLSRSSTAEED